MSVEWKQKFFFWKDSMVWIMARAFYPIQKQRRFLNSQVNGMYLYIPFMYLLRSGASTATNDGWLRQLRVFKQKQVYSKTINHAFSKEGTNNVHRRHSRRPPCPSHTRCLEEAWLPMHPVGLLLKAGRTGQMPPIWLTSSHPGTCKTDRRTQTAEALAVVTVPPHKDRFPTGTWTSTAQKTCLPYSIYITFQHSWK